MNDDLIYVCKVLAVSDTTYDERYLGASKDKNKLIPLLDKDFKEICEEWHIQENDPNWKIEKEDIMVFITGRRDNARYEGYIERVSLI